MTDIRYNLRFISGRYQGGEFPLSAGRDLLIGRAPDVDLVLAEDMVSRRHARILANSDDGFAIEDLDSTNGTFVNGEKVQRAGLRQGDRILIGTSILKLVSADGTLVSEADARRNLEQASARRSTGSSMRMSGLIEEIPLPDLLQLLSTSRKSGLLVVHNEHGDGSIYFRKGQMYYASIDDSFDLHPRKAIHRMLAWMTGSFSLEPPDDKQVLEELTDSTESLLMEGMRQIDEMQRLAKDLPPRDARLMLVAPLVAPLRELSPDELDTLQLVLNHGTLGATLDHSPRGDSETAVAVRALIIREYLVAQK